MTPPAPPSAPLPEVEIEDYRWQIAVVDAAGLALAFSQNQTGTSLGGLAYALGGPVIHGMHGHGGRVLASMALRVGLPLALAIGGGELGRQDCSGPDDYDCGGANIGGALLGFGLGVVTAMVVDDALIARPVAIRKHDDATWAPQIAVTPRHVGLGALGRF